MKKLKSILAITLSVAMTVESAQALPVGAPGRPFSFSIPSSIGYVSETWSSKASASANASTSAKASADKSAEKPDFILIQDLHVNRSVQFAISRILKQLKKQGLMPDRIAVEGETGPVEIRPMQATPDPSIRKQAADYLVTQGEMPGAMHFAVSEGEGGLFGIETDEYYQANLEMFRRSYTGRSQLRSEIEKIQAVLPQLQKDPATRKNAALLSKDLQAVSQLINNQVIPDELVAILGRASAAVERLKLVLPSRHSRESGKPAALKPLDSPLTAAGNDELDLVESLSASINFYALALLRNEELFKNSLALREMGHQKTTIVVAGGFHTEALTQFCKKNGFSYAVITPTIRQHTKVDETLYVERLMGHHLTPDQVATGQNWAAEGGPRHGRAAMQMLAIAQSIASLALWPAATRVRPRLKTVISTTLVTAMLGFAPKSSTIAPTVDAQTQVAVPTASPSGTDTGYFMTPSVKIPADYMTNGSLAQVVFEIKLKTNPQAFKKFQIRLFGHSNGVVVLDGQRTAEGWVVVLPEPESLSRTVADRAVIVSMPGPDNNTEAGVRVYVPSWVLYELFNQSNGKVRFSVGSGTYAFENPNQKLNDLRVEVSASVTKQSPTGASAGTTSGPRVHLNRANFPRGEQGSKAYILIALTAGALLAAAFAVPVIFHVDTTTMLKWGGGLVLVGLGSWWYSKRDMRDDPDKVRAELDEAKRTIGGPRFQITVDKDGVRKTPLQQPAPQITPKEPPKATPVKEDSTGGPKFHITVDKDGVRQTKPQQAAPQVTPAAPSKDTSVKEGSTEEVVPNENRSKSRKSGFWVGGVVAALVVGIISASLWLKPSQSPVEKPATTEQAAPAPPAEVDARPQAAPVQPAQSAEAEPVKTEAAKPVAEASKPDTKPTSPEEKFFVPHTPIPIDPQFKTDPSGKLVPDLEKLKALEAAKAQAAAESAVPKPAAPVPAKPRAVPLPPGTVKEVAVTAGESNLIITLTPHNGKESLPRTFFLQWENGERVRTLDDRGYRYVISPSQRRNGTIRFISPDNRRVEVDVQVTEVEKEEPSAAQATKIRIPQGFVLRPAVYRPGQETAIQGIERIESLPEINSREGELAFYADTTIDPTFLKNERGPTHFALFVQPTKPEVPLTKVSVHLINLKKNEAVTVVAERTGDDWGWAKHDNPIGKQKELLKKGYAAKWDSSLNGEAPAKGVVLNWPMEFLYLGFRLEVLTDAPFTLTPTSEKVSATPSQTAPAARPARTAGPINLMRILGAMAIALLPSIVFGSTGQDSIPSPSNGTFWITGIWAHLAGSGNYTAASAVAVVFGMILGLLQKNRDRKTTIVQVLAGFKRFPQAVRATPAAIAELASSAQDWLMNTPMVQYHTRQKVAELAKHAALVAAA